MLWINLTQSLLLVDLKNFKNILLYLYILYAFFWYYYTHDSQKSIIRLFVLNYTIIFIIDKKKNNINNCNKTYELDKTIA